MSVRVFLESEGRLTTQSIHRAAESFGIETVCYCIQTMLTSRIHTMLTQFDDRW